MERARKKEKEKYITLLRISAAPHAKDKNGKMKAAIELMDELKEGL